MSGDVLLFDAIKLEAVNVVEAHKSPLSAVALNSDGTLLATASDKGTIIRVFSVPNAQKLYQFRRGTYPARIYSMSFNLVSSLLCVSSATETVHIFRLGVPAPQSADLTRAGKKSHERTTSRDEDRVEPSSPSDSFSSSPSNHAGAAGGGYDSFYQSQSKRPGASGSIAFVRLPTPGVRSVVALSSASPQIMVVTSDGYFYVYNVDMEKGGECVLLKQFS
jgi:autophagy-related protein 18